MAKDRSELTQNVGLNESEETVLRVVDINNIVNNMGTYKKISSILNQSLLSISFLFLISIIFVYVFYTGNTDPAELFEVVKETSLAIGTYLFVTFFNLINDHFIVFLETFKTTDETITGIQGELLSIVKVIHFETELKPNKAIYSIFIMTAFLFFCLNLLNIIQAQKQTKITNCKFNNYYVPKLFLILDFFNLLDKKQLYLKEIKQLRTKTFFNNNKELKANILSIFFNIEDAEKYTIKEEIKTFFLFYSYTKLSTKKIEKNTTPRKTKEIKSIETKGQILEAQLKAPTATQKPTMKKEDFLKSMKEGIKNNE
jgi:hypothetical protein